MRKFFTALVTAICFITCASTVSADKTDWTDENYNFSNLQRVYLCEADTSSFNDLDTATAVQIQIACKKFARKLKRVVFVDDEQSADVKIIPTINVWEVSSRYVPESVEIYYEGYEKRRVKDRDGKWTTESYYKTSRMYFPGASRRERRIPAHYEYTSELNVSFEVYDGNNLIMTRHDKRSRGGTFKHLDMFKRVCKDFFKDLNKKLK